MNATFPCPVVLTKSLAKITPLTIMPLCSLSALSGSSVYSLTVPPLPPPPDQRRRLAASQFTIAPQSRPRTLYRARQTGQVVTQPAFGSSQGWNPALIPPQVLSATTDTGLPKGSSTPSTKRSAKRQGFA